jgi:hypothetical protein
MSYSLVSPCWSVSHSQHSRTYSLSAGLPATGG